MLILWLLLALEILSYLSALGISFYQLCTSDLNALSFLCGLAGCIALAFSLRTWREQLENHIFGVGWEERLDKFLEDKSDEEDNEDQ